MERLFLLGMEHECATRVPDKPLRPFGDTCLFDIYLKKFVLLAECVGPGPEHLFAGYGIALSPDDKRLVGKANAKCLPIFPRNEQSRNAHNDLATQFNFLGDIDCDWFMWPNGCAPLLKVETILGMARQFHEGEPQPITTVREKRGWIWKGRGEPLNEHAGSTQDTEPYYESTYNVHVFNKNDLFKVGHYWPRGRWWAQMYVMQDEVEMMDIDTEEDFAACEKEWRKRHG